MTTNRFSRLVLWMSLLFVPSLIPVLKAEAYGTGGIYGMVTADGYVKPGVSVLIEQLKLGTVTDHRGHYEILNLPDGEFTLVVSHIGFETVHRQIQLSSSSIHLDVTLKKAFIEQQEVTVTGSSQPTSRLMSNRVVETLTSNDLGMGQGQSMGNLLGKMPGVQSLSQGPAISKPVIRGLTNDRIVIVENGIQHEAQQWGDHHTPELEINEDDRVEVLRGPSSLLYGSGAIGGVVNIINAELPTRESGASAFGSNLNLYTATNAAARGAKLEFYGAGSNLGWKVALSGRMTDEYSVHDDDQYLVKVDDTGFSNHSLDSRLRLVSAVGQFNISFSDYKEEQILIGQGHWHNSGGGPDGTEPWYHEGGAISSPTHHRKYQLSWNLKKKAHRFELITAVQDDHREGIPEDMPSAVDLKNQVWSVEARWKGLILKNSPFTAGFSAGTNRNRTYGSEVLLPDYDSRETALFWHQWYQFNSDIFLSAGLRSDWHELKVSATEMTPNEIVGPETKRFNGTISGGLGIVWHPAETPYSLALNLGSGFRRPTPVELYINGIHHAANRYELGDPDLKEENSLSSEIIARWVDSDTDLEITMFHNRINSFVFTNPTGTTITTLLGAEIPLYQIDQSDAVLQGFEILIQYRLFSSMRFDGSCEVIRSRILNTLTDADGDGRIEQYLPFQPADNISVGLTYCFEFSSWLEEGHISVGAEHFFEQDRLAEYENIMDINHGIEFSSEDYTLVNLSMNSDLSLLNRKLGIHISILNLTNQEYTSHLSNYKGIALNPGIDFSLNLEIPLI